ncbi:MAG: hypothetical protein JWN70_5801 [Planctomycetaceae bacterium]|nr:hypothetical protein [Planctomycetaceae bacterium]
MIEREVRQTELPVQYLRIPQILGQPHSDSLSGLNKPFEGMATGGVITAIEQHRLCSQSPHAA